MEWVLGVIGVLFVVLLITLVGHGIWVAFAWLVRGGAPKVPPAYAPPPPPSQAPHVVRVCNHCQTVIPPYLQACPNCPARLELGDEDGELETARVQVQRLFQEGLLDPEVVERVTRAVAYRRQQLAVRQAMAAQPAAPEVPVAQVAPAAPARHEMPPPLPVRPLPVEPLPPASDEPFAVAVPQADDSQADEWQAGETYAAAAYAAGPQAEPIHRPPAIPPRPPAPARRPWPEVLASFMEQKNIRWGELVGGLLIVGCSVALVLSFWAEITQRPYLKFSIFTAVTGALFGLGLYTEHKWKLPTTSRGMLLIATLLVPLNFLAFAAFSRSAPASDVIAVVGESVALVLFLWLLHAAAKVIAPQWPWLLTVGVLALSAASLAVRYALPAFGAASPAALFALAAPVFVCYAAPVGGMLARARRWRPLDNDAGEAVLLFLGVVTFAAIFPAALLVVKSGDALEAARRLAPLVALGGAPALAAGLLLWRRVEGEGAAKLRTAGAAVAVMGIGVMLAAVALAWPHPAGMLPVAVADCVVLAALAFAFRVPAAHLLAAACALLAYLLGYHLFRGHVGWTSDGPTLLRTLLLPGGGTALAGLVLLMLAACEGFRRLSRLADARAWLLAATVTAGVSAVLVATGGIGRPGDPYYGTWVYALYAAASFAVAWRWRLSAGGWVGWALLLVATAQGFASYGADIPGTTIGLLAYATAAAVVAFAARRGGPDAARLFATPARGALLVTSAILVLFLAGGVAQGDTAVVALRATWLAALWLAVAVAEGSAAWFAAGQIAAAAAVVLAVFSRLQTRPWFQPAHPLADPWAWQSVGVALALLGLAWGVVRLLLKRRRPPALPVPAPLEGEGPRPIPRFDWLARARALALQTWTVDRVTSLLLGVGLLGLAVLAAAPGVAAEFAPAGTADAFQPTAAQLHAAGGGSWLFLAALLAGLAVLYAEGARSVALQGALIVTWAACALIAARAGTAGASALRWAAAGYLLAGTCAIGAAGRSRILPVTGPDWRDFWRGARQMLLVLGVAPVVVLSVVPAALALFGDPAAGPRAGSVFAGIGPGLNHGLPLLLVAGLLALAAVRARSSGYAAAALVVINLAVTVIYVVTAVTPGRPTDWAHAVRLVQLNAAATSAFALVWMAALALAARRRGTPAARPAALTASIAVALTAVAVLVVPAMAAMLPSPTRPGAFVAEVGGMWGWVALGLSATAAAGLVSGRRDRFSLAAVGIVLTVAAAMAAFAALPWETGNWVAFHTWMAAQTAAAFAMLGLGWWLHRTGRGVVSLSLGLPGTLVRADAGSSPVAETPAPAGEAASAASAASAAARLTLDYEHADDPARPPEAAVAPAVVYVGGQDVRQTAAVWAGGLGAFAVVLSLRAILDDPAAPWWSVVTVVLISLLTTAVAVWLSAPGYLYGSTLLVNLAATLFAVRSPWQTGSDPLVTLLQINVVALALPAVAWLVLERQVFARSREANRWRGGPPVHRLAALVSTVAVAIVPVYGLMADVDGRALRVSPVLTWAALASAVILMAACLWDRGARHVAAGLYVLGLVALATLVDALNLPSPRIAWAGALLLGGYALLTSGVWRAARRVSDRQAEGGPPPLPVEDERAWLVPANVALSLVVLAAAFWSDFALAERFDRLLAAFAAVAQVATIGLLARGDRGTVLRQGALLAGAAAAVALGWAFPTPAAFATDAPYPLAHRGAIAVGVLNTVAILYGVGLRRVAARAAAWAYAGRRVALPVAGAALCAMLLTLAAEAPHYQAMKQVRMHPAAIGVVLAAFFAWCGVVLYWALVPRRDPLQRSEGGRIGYVYAAEALAALGYLHIKLTLPPILPPLFNRFWPIILMGVAFLGVGLGEVFRRRNQRVLYEPLERTGAFLPLILVLAFWFAPSEANYSGVLLAAGAVYAVAAVLRRSFAFGLLAALAGNGALWYLLHHTERFGFLAHPQLWIIPAALSVLAAGELNKAVLSAAQLRALRYACLVGVYVSSTADIFISGAAQSPWLPLVLAGLSVAGVLVGVTFRVRSFLFLGTGFLTLALLAMIWNAAENLHWTWLWYVAGIVLGLLIILTFALFEKKRAEMLALVEGLRAWE